MVNCAWTDIFPAARSSYLRFEGPGHRPLLTILDTSKVRRRRPFRYDRRVQENDDVRRIIEKAWKPEESEQVRVKMDRVRIELIKWSKEEKANSAKTILTLQAKLEETLSSKTPDAVVITETKLALEKAYKAEELF